MSDQVVYLGPTCPSQLAIRTHCVWHYSWGDVKKLIYQQQTKACTPLKSSWWAHDRYCAYLQEYGWGVTNGSRNDQKTCVSPKATLHGILELTEQLQPAWQIGKFLFQSLKVVWECFFSSPPWLYYLGEERAWYIWSVLWTFWRLSVVYILP